MRRLSHQFQALIYHTLSVILFCTHFSVLSQSLTPDAQQQQRQQDRERALREREEIAPDARRPVVPVLSTRLPPTESPCFVISHIALQGDAAERFDWALDAADAPGDPALGRCLGTVGINTVMTRIQNAIVARGFVTTRILAAPQDLTTGTLRLTLIPGRIRQLRFAPVTVWTASRLVSRV